LRLTAGGSAGVVLRGRGLVVTWICCIAVSFHWLALPRRSREQGALRIGEIASLVLHSACGREYLASQVAESPPAR
jgi:hypothetical protein